MGTRRMRLTRGSTNWNRPPRPDYLRRLFKCRSHSRPHDRQCPPTRAACAGAWNGNHGVATGGAAVVRYSALWNTQPNSHMSGEEAAEYRRPSESREAQLHQVHNPHSILRMKRDLSATYCKTDEESQSAIGCCCCHSAVIAYLYPRGHRYHREGSVESPERRGFRFGCLGKGGPTRAGTLKGFRAS